LQKKNSRRTERNKQRKGIGKGGMQQGEQEQPETKTIEL
jgi:hypothetical protein